MNGRPYATALLDMCRDGTLDPVAVLENALVNFMSSDDADEFARSEYNIKLDKDE